MTEVRVKAAIADKKVLTLYCEDGTIHTIPQGDPRVARLVEIMVPIHARGEIAVVSLENYNAYADFTKKTNGLVRFFKVARQKVVDFFNTHPDPEPVQTELSEPIIREAPVRITAEQVIAEAEEITDSKDNLTSDQTVVAVIKTETSVAVLPEAENLKDAINHAATTNRTVGMEKFLQRTASIEYGHSQKDLLRFMERGDLPVADDGCIIAYKVLRRKYGQPGVFVDCHTGKVQQKVGSFVVVDPSMVDRNRRNECSNGLHIARRGYIGGFAGDVCVIVKLAPEDVVTVPHGDANKVRVCGYHILFELPDEAYQKLRKNHPMTDNPEAAKMLAAAMSGNHVAKLEEVRINGQMGTDVVITPLTNGGKKKLRDLSSEEKQQAQAFDAVKVTTDPKKINAMIVEEEAKAALERELAVPVAEPVKEEAPSKPVAIGSNKELALTYYTTMLDETNKLSVRQEAANNLAALKKKAKVPYERLNLDTKPTLELIAMTLAEVEEVKPQTKTKPAKQAEVSKDEAKTDKPVSNKDRARTLYNMKDWLTLADLKKKSKVSWSKLGFTAKEEEEILGVLKK